jgi:glycosyltransferase involved in cell wall biosynthesis
MRLALKNLQVSSSSVPPQLMPTISLILTTHNRAQFLPIALNSILAQTYSDFELILWDDGSTDQTLTILQNYSDSRIRLFSAPHQGRTDALIAAHAQATGEYIAWVDSDDRLSTTTLANTMAILINHPNLGMVYTDYQVIDEQGQAHGIGSRCKIPYSENRLLTDFMTFHFRLLRHSLYEQVGGVDADLPCAMDYDLCLKLSEVTEIYHLPKCLYDYRSHSQTISQAQRKLQTTCAKRAIENALQRRGMSDRYRLDVQHLDSGKAQFRLFTRSSAPQTKKECSIVQ